MPSSTSTPKRYLFLLTILLATLLAGAFLIGTGPALAQDPPTPEPDSSGTIPEAAPILQERSPGIQAPSAISIMCFSTDNDATDACARLAGIFDDVSPITSLANFPNDLAPYDVVYLGNNEGTTLDSKASQLQSYVDDGGGLVVTQPNIEGDVDVYPPGFEMHVSDLFWPEYPSSPGPVEFTAAATGHPILTGLTPEALSGNFDTVPLDQVGPGWTVLAKSVANPILALAVGEYGSGRMAFHTGNIESGAIDSGSDAFIRQLIEWAASAAVLEGPDMQIDAIEVTQAVQDLNNSVELVAGKRTYVRVHASAPGTVRDVFANLSATRGGTRLYPTLAPGNPGADIRVYSAPDRGQLNDSFWFELPASWTTAGDLNLTATLDPAAATGDPNGANNSQSVTVSFLETPPLRLKLFNVRYTMNGTTHLAADSHLDSLESWLERGYPIDTLQSTRHTFTYPRDGLPDVDRLHGYLALGKLLNILFAGENSDIVYYGMVDDGGDFMRGKALDIPSTIAAGPAGTPRTTLFPWDDDDSYADWYGAHELAHTQGRYHAEFCGAGGGRSYPYPGGDISPDTTGSDELYGFDIESRRIYNPNWNDVMTYCPDQWISDFTYEGIRDHLVNTAMLAPSVSANQFLVVVASVDLDDNSGTINDLYVLDQQANIPLPESGEWSVVLLDENDNELASYAIEPDELTDSHDAPGRPGLINAVLPSAPNLHRVEIRYQGTTIDAREMSANPPTVTITAPEAGDEFSEGTFTFSWDGSDPDGDPLSYSVLYSHNNGETWTPLATSLTEEELVLHTDYLPGGTGLVRVVASDGMRATSDTAGPFYPPGHAPQVNIISPADGATLWPAQLAVFKADVFDLEEGTLDGDHIVWSSSLDGPLGTGKQVSTVNLSTGEHTITALVTDSSNRTAEATITIEVVTGDAPEPTMLEVAPGGVSHYAPEGSTSNAAYDLTFGSSSGLTLTWSISEDADWLSVTPDSGDTPGTATLTIDPTGKAVGDHQAGLIVTTPGAENSPVEIPVVLTIGEREEPPRFELYLPVILAP